MRHQDIIARCFDLHHSLINQGYMYMYIRDSGDNCLYTCFHLELDQSVKT